MMQNTGDDAAITLFRTHAFDTSNGRQKAKKKKMYILGKPKHVTKGGHGIRQYIKIDETKLTSEQRFRKNINISNVEL